MLKHTHYFVNAQQFTTFEIVLPPPGFFSTTCKSINYGEN